MLPSRPSRWLLASGLGHAAIFALLLAMPQAPPPVATAPALRVTELNSGRRAVGLFVGDTVEVSLSPTNIFLLEG